MSLTSQEIVALQREIRHTTCGVCGGERILHLTEPYIRCAADPTHEGYTRNPLLRAECEAGRGPIGLRFKERAER